MINSVIKARIIELRYKGISYKAISDKLEISKDNVRNFCRRNHLTGADLNSSSLCINCGEEIIQPGRGSRKIFCSEKCRSAWRRSTLKYNEMRYDHVCAGCGTQFTTTGNKTQRYCSMDCYQNHRGGNAS